MEELDLKNIWKASQKNDLEKQLYSMEDIIKFRSQKSKQTTRSTRLMFLFDIGLKCMILLAFLFILILVSHQSPYQFIVSLIILIMIGLILLNVRFLKQFNAIKETDSVIHNLKKKLVFHKTVYYQFLIINALSSPLFVLAGFFIYEFYKYGQIQMGSPINDPVLYVIVIVAFCFSFFAQLPVYNRQLKELKESIDDVDDITLAAIQIEDSKKTRRNQFIWFSIIALIGIMLFFILMLN